MLSTISLATLISLIHAERQTKIVGESNGRVTAVEREVHYFDYNALESYLYPGAD